MQKVINIILSLFILTACNQKQQISCAYRLDDVLKLDSPSAFITYKNDTLVEVQDRIVDSLHSTGLYTFDKKGILRFYAFFPTKTNYIFSEQYDENGMILKTEGTPLVEVRLHKEKLDTVVFNIFLFALNRQYEFIRLLSNKNDTIIPANLFLSNFNTNIKCFSFKLPILKIEGGITFRSEVKWVNKCNSIQNSHFDTTSIGELQL